MVFCHKRNPLNFEYPIGGTAISFVIEIKDLGVELNNQLCYNLLMNKIISKPLQMLGFIKSCCQDFRNINAFFYCSLVRSHLE